MEFLVWLESREWTQLRTSIRWPFDGKWRWHNSDPQKQITICKAERSSGNYGTDSCFVAQTSKITSHTSTVFRKLASTAPRLPGKDVQSSQESTTHQPTLKKNYIYLFLIDWGLLYNIGWFLPYINMNQTEGYKCLLPLEPLSHPSRLLQSPSLSSLSHAANFQWLSI